METIQSGRQAANLVDQPQLYRLLAVDHAAHVGSQLSGLQHELGKGLPLDFAVGGNKLCDTLLDPLEVVEGLGHSND